MIFINREQQQLMIPKHINVDIPLKLTLKHNLTGTDYVFDAVDNGTSTVNWVFDNIDFTKLPTGEYNYDLNGSETGLLQIIQTTTEPISYTSEKTIIQYGS